MSASSRSKMLALIPRPGSARNESHSVQNIAVSSLDDLQFLQFIGLNLTSLRKLLKIKALSPA